MAIPPDGGPSFNARTAASPSEFPSAFPKASIATVSYTHLDVYKRQAQDNDACPVEAAVNRRINAALASAEAALMAAFGDMRLLEIATEVAKPRLATPRP